MQILEVFFDYACPYCMRGHEYLTGLLAGIPDLKIDWRPCEAHPRPEKYGRHSDLLARGMYIARDLSANLAHYHALMYRAALRDHINVEDPRAVASAAGRLVNTNAFYQALCSGAHMEELRENNRLAWSELHFPAVPSYRMGGRLLKSVENIGVAKATLAKFIKGADA